MRTQLLLLPLLLTLHARAAEPAPVRALVARPAENSAALNLLREVSGPVIVELRSGDAWRRAAAPDLVAGVPTEVALSGLPAGRASGYRVRDEGGAVLTEGRVQTARAPGEAFTFTVQGDSHPERAGKMFSAALYARAAANIAADAPDFHLMMGDDFSIERLIERDELSPASVGAVYARQREYLAEVARSAAVFTVNGNHEQAARANLAASPNNPALLAGAARIRYFSPPAPDAFYTGDTAPVPGLGLPRDYYAWTWGDALFVVLDPYWHSPVTVDNTAGRRAKDDGGDSGRGKRDLWQITLGDAQYAWLQATLTHSAARWKFVFCHHVLGTGRGGVENARLYEWGGQDRSGANRFAEKRPGWREPIHQLMAGARVTIFFQGHDHLYARQELDGVIYQTCPLPADDRYQIFNREAYRSGDVLANSGHLRVAVSPERVAVDYVRAVLPAHEAPERANRSVAARYEITASTAVPSATAPATAR